MAPSRNGQCPCGSGKKYKRCCLAEQAGAKQRAAFDDAVGDRIQDWSARVLSDELGAALEEFVGADRVMSDEDLQVFATWFHNDREVASGGTPAELYAALSDLPAAERLAARRIATARLGLHRVLAVDPGSWLVLEDIVTGTRVRVMSSRVSREAVRWDVLLARVMDGNPPSMWGPVRCFAVRRAGAGRRARTPVAVERWGGAVACPAHARPGTAAVRPAGLGGRAEFLHAGG